MKWKTITSIITISAVFTIRLSAQSATDLNSFRDLFRPATSQQDYSLKIDNKNEFRLLLTGGFAVYKSFVSSQDGMKCTFYPSCSVYALNSIKENGLLGVLDAIDRLTRCNGLSPEKYHIHEQSERFYDPVKKLHH